MSEKVTIAVDALGGDNAPDVVLDGVAQALAEDAELTVILCGPDEVVSPFAASHERCVAQVATEAIGMGEHPAQAVRKKKDSSIVVGCRLVKEGAAQGFFSAGSTGACLAAATLVMGRVKGIARPALATVLPSPVRPVVMCDVGANADCKPEYLVQFARMGSVYAQKMLGIESPRAALLNIGEEEEKGSQFAQAAHKLMREKLPNFAGNAEGGDVLAATFDVYVCDGFTGNVCLKTIEGTSKVLFKTLKDIMMKSVATKLGALALKGGLSDLKKQVSPDTYGGAPLLGVNGACIVGHGSSSATAVKNGVLTSAKLVRERVSEIIAQTATA
ncbi:MAG TPA: phosphate acyltransferase PlsX [Candidatus Aphodovivens excrementavium]|nr:phosphate acyltransferase PlsX [Candidatus Aphodovivens excrementavium]